jgi:zinc protease
MRRTTRARWRACNGSTLTTRRNSEQVKSWPDRVRGVTAEQVREAARAWLDKRRSVTGYLVKDTRPSEKRS